MSSAEIRAVIAYQAADIACPGKAAQLSVIGTGAPPAPDQPMKERVMMPKMTYLTNALTAAAVSLAAITSGAAPAQAGDKDLLRALAGIAAVAVIVGAIDNNNRHQVPVTRHVRNDGFTRPDQGWHNGYGGSQAENDWDRRNDHRGARALPSSCALEVGNRYPTVYYTESCLRRAGVSRNLPEYCAQTVRSRDWTGRVYEEDCLRDAGYRTRDRY